MKISVKTIFRSFFWLILSAIFGQLQLWVVWGSNSLTVNPNMLTYDKVILDGYILFFCTGITASLALDYYFDNRITKRGEQLIYSLFPIVVVLLGVLIGTNLLGKDPKQVNLEGIKFFHIWLMGLTSVYVVTIKYKAFIKI